MTSMYDRPCELFPPVSVAARNSHLHNTAVGCGEPLPPVSRCVPQSPNPGFSSICPSPPSSNRTSGFPESSRLGHSQRRLPLLGLSAQLRPHNRDYFRSRAYAQAGLYPSRLKHASSKAPSLHRHYPASSLLWASPTPVRNHSRGYVFPQGVAASPASRRASQVPRLIFQRTPSPSTPESPTVAFSRFFTAGTRFHHLRQPDHSHLCISRPNQVRLRYGLRFRLSRLRQVGLLRLALDWLHVIREIHMVSSFQLTRSASLILAHQRHREPIDFSVDSVPLWCISLANT